MAQTITTTSKISRPSLGKYIGEHIKVIGELWRYYQFKKTFNPSVSGDGHPVLILPGFMASDISTKHFRRFLKRIGYTPYPWNLGRNYGDISQLNTLLQQIENLYQKHQTKISLIGWSLGGVYARQLAKNKPEFIRQVITMSSPFAGINEPNNAAWLYKIVNYNKKIKEADKKWMEDIPAPAPVPTTAIYSKDDGIVPWQTCMEQTVDAIHQNVRIKGTHFGLGYNPEVWKIVEDRLLFTIENWQVYR